MFTFTHKQKWKTRWMFFSPVKFAKVKMFDDGLPSLSRRLKLFPYPARSSLMTALCLWETLSSCPALPSSALARLALLCPEHIQLGTFRPFYWLSLCRHDPAQPLCLLISFNLCSNVTFSERPSLTTILGSSSPALYPLFLLDFYCTFYYLKIFINVIVDLFFSYNMKNV